MTDLERILGPDHPSTLAVRRNIAFWTAQCGHREEALRLCEELLPHQERVLGPDHPDTLRTRRAINQLRTSGITANNLDSNLQHASLSPLIAISSVWTLFQ